MTFDEFLYVTENVWSFECLVQQIDKSLSLDVDIVRRMKTRFSSRVLLAISTSDALLAYDTYMDACGIPSIPSKHPHATQRPSESSGE